jgi:hypothetical protein
MLNAWRKDYAKLISLNKHAAKPTERTLQQENPTYASLRQRMLLLAEVGRAKRHVSFALVSGPIAGIRWGQLGAKSESQFRAAPLPFRPQTQAKC